MTFLYVLYRFYQLPETTLDFFYPAAILRRGMFFRRLRTPAEPEESPTAAERSEKLENVLIIGADADFSNSQITSLGSLRKINGNAKFSNSPITNLGNLEFIGDTALMTNSRVINLGKLRQIEGDLHIDANSQTDFQNVAIKGDIIKH